MPMIQVRLNNGQAFNTSDGTTYMDGPELVAHRVQENEGAESKFEVLTRIVGRLVERHPVKEWLDIVGSNTLDEVRR